MSYFDKALEFIDSVSMGYEEVDSKSDIYDCVMYTLQTYLEADEVIETWEDVVALNAKIYPEHSLSEVLTEIRNNCVLGKCYKGASGDIQEAKIQSLPEDLREIAQDQIGKIYYEAWAIADLAERRGILTRGGIALLCIFVMAHERQHAVQPRSLYSESLANNYEETNASHDERPEEIDANRVAYETIVQLVCK